MTRSPYPSSEWKDPRKLRPALLKTFELLRGKKILSLAELTDNYIMKIYRLTGKNTYKTAILLKTTTERVRRVRKRFSPTKK